ncbi:MAG: replicative DNA helicase [Spirochaetales bacterium]|jgi:replicative DNA helicase|nr:replicative DNA helicase [Spirochaetales bacterium]
MAVSSQGIWPVRQQTDSQLKDGVPPHNDEAEKAVLGAVLLNTDSEIVTEVFNILREEDFYKTYNRIIYSAILRLSNRHDSIDFITLKDEMRASGELDKIDIAYLASLTTGVPSSANAVYYAKIVEEASVRRILLRTSAEISAQAYNDTKDLGLIIDEAEKGILAIANARHATGYVHAGSLVTEAISRIENFYRTQGAYTGIPCGYPDVDNLLSGFQKSELIIIGARPSVGKTSLALCMAANIAGISKKGHEGHAAGFFSLEMNRMAIMQRVLASEARVNSHSIRTGMLQPMDFNSLSNAAGRIYEAPLYISDTPNMELLDLRAEARRMHKQKNVEIIFIDYIGLIQAENKDIPQWQQYSDISMSLKGLARELDIPIVAMSQLGRQVEKQAGGPSMADLRGSGSIEQDADVVMILDRERKPFKKNGGGEEEVREYSPVEKLKLDIVKQRNGPTGPVALSFIRSCMRFESCAEKADK